MLLNRLKELLASSLKCKIIVGVVLTLGLSYGCFYLLGYRATQHAARIFNEQMAEQKLLRGNLTVETLSANMQGVVSFTNLEWVNKEGQIVAQIPAGHFRIKPWAVVTKHYDASAITDIVIRDAKLALRFDDKMRLIDIDASRPEKEIDKKKKKTSFVDGLKAIDCHLTLENCFVDIYYQARNLQMLNVYADLDYDSKDELQISFSSGKFGGTIEADGLQIRGNVDFKEQAPLCKGLLLIIENCNPASIAAGINVHEKVSAKATINGRPEDPVVKGSLSMPELRIPALNFADVDGDFTYKDGLIKASKITAKLYAGQVLATGNFNIDTKAYQLDIQGTNLEGGYAAHNILLKCLVDLQVKIDSDGNPKNTVTTGTFASGKGSLGPVNFTSIKGSFKNINKLLTFKEVEIKALDDIAITAPHFFIDHGKLNLGDIYMQDPKTGRKHKVN